MRKGCDVCWLVDSLDKLRFVTQGDQLKVPLAEVACVQDGWGRGAGAFGAAADTERHASALARAWCHRLQFFFELEGCRGGA
eukprot:2863540-Pyramimonas_sp.AAC.1